MALAGFFFRGVADALAFFGFSAFEGVSPPARAAVTGAERIPEADTGAEGRTEGESAAAGRAGAKADEEGATGRTTAVVEPPKPGVALPGGLAGFKG